MSSDKTFSDANESASGDTTLPPAVVLGANLPPSVLEVDLDSTIAEYDPALGMGKASWVSTLYDPEKQGLLFGDPDMPPMSLAVQRAFMALMSHQPLPPTFTEGGVKKSSLFAELAEKHGLEVEYITPRQIEPQDLTPTQEDLSGLVAQEKPSGNRASRRKKK